jgi:hypothetical protein
MWWFMKSYTVITSDGKKVGHVVGESGENLVVESGHVFKAKHLVPKVFATVKEGEELVCVTVTKDVVDDSPSIDGGQPDEQVVMQHYGLAGGFDAPDTEGDDSDDVPPSRGRTPTALAPGETPTSRDSD